MMVLSREAEQARCRAEIATLEALLRSGHEDVGGIMLALADWRAERLLIEQELRGEAEKPAAAGAGRARKEAFDAKG